MALSLLDMKDRPLQSPGRESQSLQSGGAQDQSGSVQLNSASKCEGSSCTSRTETWKRERQLQATSDTEAQINTYPNKQIPGTGQTLQVSEEESDLDQPQKRKRSKNRRQRRKRTGQTLVGLPCSPSAPPPVLLWFRRDLRLCDNPALMASLQVGAPVIPVFIWSPEEEEGRGVTVAVGGACKFEQGISFSNFPLQNTCNYACENV